MSEPIAVGTYGETYAEHMRRCPAELRCKKCTMARLGVPGGTAVLLEAGRLTLPRGELPEVVGVMCAGCGLNLVTEVQGPAND